MSVSPASTNTTHGAHRRPLFGASFLSASDTFKSVGAFENQTIRFLRAAQFKRSVSAFRFDHYIARRRIQRKGVTQEARDSGASSAINSVRCRSFIFTSGGAKTAVSSLGQTKLRRVARAIRIDRRNRYAILW